MSCSSLHEFGELLMKRVRDEAITDWDMILDGRMKSPHAKTVRQLLASFDAQQIDVLYRLVPDVVDTTLHHFLWMVEQVKGVDLVIHTNKDMELNVREASDGLTGELFGWIQKYSQQRYDQTV